MVLDTINSPNCIIPAPAQKMYVHSSKPIAHNLTNVLVEREMQHDIKEYYEKHHNIRPKVLHDIDWDASKKALATKSEISYRKTFHNLRNTMSVNKKWKRAESDLCPMCAKEPETLHHLLSCTHDDIKYVRNLSIAKFTQTLKKLNTQPDIVSHWTQLLERVTTNQPIKSPTLSMTNPSSWRLIQAHQQQTGIGWGCFFKGMLGKKWTMIQQSHYNGNQKDGENIHRWKRIVLRMFFDMMKDL